MCTLCSGGSNTGFACEDTSGSQELLASELVTGLNTSNKQSLTLTQAAAQITRDNMKWNDSTDANYIGSAGTVTWAFAATPDSGYTQLNTAMMAFVDKAILAIEFGRADRFPSGRQRHIRIAGILGFGADIDSGTAQLWRWMGELELHGRAVRPGA